MGNSESIGRRFNRREIKWALRSDSIEVTQFLVSLPPTDTIKLTSKMFEELRFPDFPAYVFACREAVELVEEHENDKREMIDEIYLVIERFIEAEAVTSEKKTNLAIATYISLARVNEMANFLTSTAGVSEGDGPSR